MNYCNPLRDINYAVHYTILRLPNEVGFWPKGVEEKDFIVECFPQNWGNTNCGFAGMAGNCCVTACTTVITIKHLGHTAVFVNEKFAYAIEKPNLAFAADLAARRLEGAARIQGSDYYEHRR